jgi:hypothetical protein
MKVRTKLKVGTVCDDVGALLEGFAVEVKDRWDELPGWLTWPW